MPTTTANSVFRHLRRAALLGAGPEISDGQLLEQFIACRDDAAFALLVRRHGPLVLGVCRRMIGNIHDAEDAFQATFLVLARKAATIVPREAVGNWLYGVAYRTARRAKATAARRWAREKQVKNMPQPIVEPASSIEDLASVLDEEVSALADKYRLPLVLCELEGRPRKQVARQLKLPEGTLSTRLARARRMLAQRLRRRGVMLSGGVLATILGGNAALACVPLPLVSSTIKAATSAAAGGAATSAVSAKVAALTEGVLKTMLLTKLKIAMAVLLVAGILAGGVATFARPALATGQTDAGKPRKPEPAAKGAKKAQAAMRWKERLAVNAPDDEKQTYSVAVSPDGKTIAVGYTTATKVLDATTGQELVTLPGGGRGPRGIAFSPDGKLIAQGGPGDVLVHSADSGQVKARLQGATKNVYSVAFSPDGKTLATVGETVRLWDLATNKEIRQFKSEGPREHGVLSVAFSPDGKKLATAEGSDNAVKVWDVATGEELATFEHPNWVIAVAFSSDGKTVAAANGGEKSQMKLWDLATGKERATLKGPVGGFNALAFSPDGKILASAAQRDANDKIDNVVRLWDAATGKQVAALKSHQVRLDGDSRDNVLWGLAFSRDGSLVTAGDDAVRIWEAEKRPAANKE